MKVLILGAGGLTGRYLVRESKRRGMEVVSSFFNGVSPA